MPQVQRIDPRDTWNTTVILGILQNEKYKGDAMLQKTYSPSLFEHRSRKNEGQLAKYYVSGCLPVIVDPQIWKAVQEEMARRRAKRASIKRLIIMPGGSAAFASWGKENAFVKQLSEENPGMLLTHLWMNEGKGTCGNYHWQDGRIVADDTPTSETELAGLIQKIKQEIVRAEEHDLDDFSQDDLGMR